MVVLPRLLPCVIGQDCGSCALSSVTPKDVLRCGHPDATKPGTPTADWLEAAPLDAQGWPVAETPAEVPPCPGWRPGWGEDDA